MIGESPPGRSEEEREAARLARERARAERAARRDGGGTERSGLKLPRVGLRRPRPASAAASEPDPPPPALVAAREPDPPPTERASMRERADALLSARGRSGRGGEGGGSSGGPEAGRFRRRRIVGLAVLAVLALAALWAVFSVFQPGKGEGEGTVAITIPRGAGVGEIGDLLDERDVVASGFLFELRATLGGRRGDLKPGTYNLKRDMSYSAALDALAAGPPANLANVTIPEGTTRREVAPRIREAGLEGNYVTATKRSPLLNPRRYGAARARDLEGFLFPATYQLRKGSSVRSLVERQLTTFKREFAKVDLRAAKKVNLTAYDVLIIASLVEREAQVAKERKVIASVIYNRLKRGMTLGIDATVRYATNNWTRPLRQSELNSPSPYNTRRNPGLPPGPIGNPGLASIEAAARPARTDYLFYVVKPGTCGEHAFSSTDAEFQRDVQRYNEARAARGGQSPTDC